MGTERFRARCVVLSAEPPEAIDARIGPLLEARGWRAWHASDPLTAMADLCVLRATLATRAAFERGDGETLALVVVDPPRFPDADALLAAAARYVPEASRWTLTDGRLEPVEPHAPQTRQQGVASAQSATDPEPATISREEIEMLLRTESRDTPS